MKVNNLGKINLAERQSEFSHVSTDLGEGGCSLEISSYKIRDSASDALKGAVLSEPLAPDFADKAQFSHYFQYRLFRDGNVELTAQAHEDLAMAATICSAVEDFPDLLMNVRTCRSLRMFTDIVIARPCQPNDLQKKIKIMLP